MASKPDVPPKPDVIIVGGGIIGLSAGWKLRQEGVEVVVLDPAPGTGASHAAAGMLAPIHEAYWGESHILRLNLAASQAWPAFAHELGVDTVDYRRNGTLMAAFDADDKAVLDNLGDLHEQEGLPVERLRSKECRAREPLLAPGVRGGVYSPVDHQVNPRRVVAELLNRVPTLAVSATEVTGNQVVADDGRVMSCQQVVVAAGAWTGRLLGVPIRPLKGQILRLSGPERLLRLPVRGVVRGSTVYAVPRSNGEIVVGATQEEQGFDTRVTAGGVYELLRDVLAVLPGLNEIDLVETWAGLRPGAPDNAPIIGTGDDGIVYATGHYRNGILTAPITAAAVSALVQGRKPPVDLAPFSPNRFHSDCGPSSGAEQPLSEVPG
ncbi:MAG: glycine oxidase ThiO [Acidimicrobiia bacterium]|nr:glycine oxidase ThiO [Acidimicrobiia bacterium]MYG57144.1 glycine oxidase ThiO [Acidimicrobiia bacterium]MYJ31440.1 glycine oxidase ThiO [Acidimicrobiia bacterium]